MRMRKEWELELVRKYPNLYQNYNRTIYQSAMAWGFSCGDGWFNIIDELSAKLEPLGVVAEQVKEKFGSLRFYYRYPNDIDEETRKKIEQYIAEAESQSLVTCESCGKKAEMRVNKNGWRMTLCDECYSIKEKLAT